MSNKMTSTTHPRRTLWYNAENPTEPPTTRRRPNTRRLDPEDVEYLQALQPATSSQQEEDEEEEEEEAQEDEEEEEQEEEEEEIDTRTAYDKEADYTYVEQALCHNCNGPMRPQTKHHNMFEHRWVCLDKPGCGASRRMYKQNKPKHVAQGWAKKTPSSKREAALKGKRTMGAQRRSNAAYLGNKSRGNDAMMRTVNIASAAHLQKAEAHHEAAEKVIREAFLATPRTTFKLGSIITLHCLRLQLTVTDELILLVAWYIGCWLGDGFSNAPHVMCQNSDKSGVVDTLNRLAELCHLSVSPYGDKLCKNYFLRPLGYTTNNSKLNLLNCVIRSLGIRYRREEDNYHDKQWGRLSRIEENNLRQAIIAGFIDTDGFRGHHESHLTISQHRLRLILGLREMAWLCGFGCKLTTMYPTVIPSGAPSYSHYLSIYAFCDPSKPRLQELPIRCDWKQIPHHIHH